MIPRVRPVGVACRPAVNDDFEHRSDFAQSLGRKRGRTSRRPVAPGRSVRSDAGEGSLESKPGAPRFHGTASHPHDGFLWHAPRRRQADSRCCKHSRVPQGSIFNAQTTSATRSTDFEGNERVPK